VVMYFHGGGWIMGDAHTHDRLVRELVTQAQCALVFVEYTHSPEAQYPVPLLQAYAATCFIAENAQHLGVDASRLAVAGDSVGGNMAAVVALLAKQFNGPTICAQLLFYPVTDARFDTNSYCAFAEGPWLTRRAMQWCWDTYLPNVALRGEWTASPLRATSAQLRGLPDTLVFTDENDVLRDEGEAYARKMAEAGVKVTHVRYMGTIHDFMMLNALADSIASRAAIAQASEYLRQAFLL
jgi:acetyl esterase